MKARLLALITATFLLCSPASAQNYSVRLAAATNLRAAASLEADIIEVAPSGTILQVVGETDQWLKINRNGNEVWMANWINYSRVENNQLPGFDVYNCCFLDRQCATDEEWNSGFQAFQNNQCDVRGVTIQGSDPFVIRMKEAFAMLKDRVPVWYAYATGGLDKIREIPESGSPGVYVQRRTFDETPSQHFYDGPGETPIIWVVGGLVHEACHVYLYEAGLFAANVISAEEEALCTQVQLAVVDAVDPTDHFNRYLQSLIDNIDNPDYQWWD
ncbi:MAG: SH3 domain-containing protein [Chloroflexi bacterium]|nr:SH3 domain-containing protein [Chloroflexota bacterium]